VNFSNYSVGVGQSDTSAKRPTKFHPALHESDVPPQHFKGRLTITNIYGEWWASARDGFFTIRWKRYFAYLHQFDPSSRDALIAQCESAHRQRDYPHVLPSKGEGDHA
jgi:hypothetical protein